MKQNFTDTFLIRYNSGECRVVSEHEAFAEWDLRVGDTYWQTVHSVSLMPGNKFGMGQAIVF
jgi:hypothetical protein